MQLHYKQININVLIHTMDYIALKNQLCCPIMYYYH